MYSGVMALGSDHHSFTVYTELLPFEASLADTSVNRLSQLRAVPSLPDWSSEEPLVLLVPRGCIGGGGKLGGVSAMASMSKAVGKAGL